MITTPTIRIALQSRRAWPIQKKLSIWQMLEGPAEDVWPAKKFYERSWAVGFGLSVQDPHHRAHWKRTAYRSGSCCNQHPVDKIPSPNSVISLLIGHFSGLSA
jgi:hypothetical protein